MNSRRGLTGEMRKIISEEGFRALWKGVGPAMTRASALTASQLATYDESKQVLFLIFLCFKSTLLKELPIDCFSFF